MDPRRVLIVTAMYPRSEDPSRGLVVKREVDALLAAGWEVDVVSKPRGARAYLAQWKQMRTQLRRHKYAAVHAHYGTAALLPRLHPGRFRRIVTLHGSDVATGPRPRISKFWVQWLVSVVGCIGADVVFVQAGFMRDLLPGWARKKAVVAPQAIDLDVFRPQPGSPRDDVVLFLGRRDVALKRFWLARATVEGLRDVRLAALDEVAPASIPDAMRRAKVGLLTSEREGMPVSIKEALASGLPVVAVDLPATRELAEVLPTLRVAAHDAQSLRKEIEVALRDPPSPEAQERVRDVFRRRGWDAPGHLRIIEGAYLASALPAP